MPEVLGLRELGGDDPGEVALAAEPPEGAAPVAGAPDVAAPPPWRRWAAIGVVVVLFLVVGYLLTAGRPRRPGPAAGAKLTTVASPAERGARAALDAWARFASTGDVDQLRDTFDPQGPQLGELSAEAAGMQAPSSAGASYGFSANVLQITAGRNQDEELVAADVVLSRPGEADQAFGWTLVMRRSDGRWRLWTVRDRAGTSTSTTAGAAP